MSGEEKYDFEPSVVPKGGRRRRRKTRRKRKKFKKHYMWNTKGKRYLAKTYKQHIKGKKLGHTHKKPKRKRRRTRRRRTKRRRTRRKRMRGGGWVTKNNTFKNAVELNKKVMDPPVPSRNVAINDVVVPGVSIQRGGGAMSIIPGWNDVRDMYWGAVNGVKDIGNTLRGDHSEKSYRVDKDQYTHKAPRASKFSNIPQIHRSAEEQASRYNINGPLEADKVVVPGGAGGLPGGGPSA